MPDNTGAQLQQQPSDVSRHSLQGTLHYTLYTLHAAHRVALTASALCLPDCHLPLTIRDAPNIGFDKYRDVIMTMN